jgi:hypothetical protein
MRASMLVNGRALLVLALLAPACTIGQCSGSSGSSGPSGSPYRTVTIVPFHSPAPVPMISDNKALIQPPGADYCHQGGQVVFQWTVTGAKQGDILVVNFSGFANQNTDNVSIPLDANLMAERTFPFVGSGTWKSHVVSVAGVHITQNVDNTTSNTCG